jgi:streptogramin lyase
VRAKYHVEVRMSARVTGAVAVPVLAAIAMLTVVAMGSRGSAKATTDYIQGQVTGPGGPEAGVWVIAQTNSLGTPFRKIVVTDDDGRFVIPQLTPATYKVWVRGYGLRDTEKVSASPGTDSLTIRAQRAGRVEAAEFYPASYWLSMMAPPGDVPDTDAFFSSVKLGCELCHQLGSKATRTLTRAQLDHGWMKASTMNGTADGFGRDRMLDMVSAWSAKVRAGETPPAPPRPSGLERNMVVTQWEWGDRFTYAHDEIATDKRDPTKNANGRIYGVDIGNDHTLFVDPVTNRAGAVETPTLNGFRTDWCHQTYVGPAGGDPLPNGFGTLGCPADRGESDFEDKYRNAANPHNPMMDAAGRVWLTTQVRREWAADMPEFCKSDPVIFNNRHHRQLGVFDPKTGKTELIDTCYGTHHLQFDRNGRLWVSGDVFVVGWFDPDKYDPARPETLKQAQGYAQLVVDSDGDGTKDTPVIGFNYGIIPNPADGSVWTAQPFTGARGIIVRYDPATGVSEEYRPPEPGSGPRGVDVDTTGVIWAAMGGSGDLGRFDRSKCARTWGTGDQCPEGWTFYRSPGPSMKKVDGTDGTKGADYHYYLWVDQFNTLGMGKDIVILNGTGSDSLLAFDPTTEKFTTIRIPYPLNTFTRGLDGRIDNPNTGWKGRGLWFDNGLDPLLHSEVQRSYVGKVQLRPDPLAK